MATGNTFHFWPTTNVTGVGLWPFTTTATTATTVSTTFTVQNVTWASWDEDQEQAAREARSALMLASKVRMEGAQDRAMELLMMILTPEERTWYDQHDEIAVRGDEGGLYVIEKRSVHGNIRLVDEHGCLLGRVCVAPGMYDEGEALPLADGWIGQYLAIKHQEGLMREAGNWSYRGTCHHSDVPVLRQLDLLAA